MERIYNFKAVAKQRPRLTRSGHVYTPKQTREFEKNVGLLWGYPLTNKPLIANVEIYIKTPSKFRKSEKIRALMGKIKPVTTPDIDNVLKAIFDGLNGVAYEDDKQIFEVTARKHYAEKNYFTVRLTEYGED